MHQIRRENPSFSSSLLDAIYRSIDEPNGINRDEELIFHRDKAVMRKKKQNSTSLKQEELNNSVRRACMIDKWMQKKQVISSTGGEIKVFGIDPMFLNSNSTSSDSSCVGGFSSSESDSFYSAKTRSLSQSSTTSHCHRSKPKPIKTSIFPLPKPEVLGKNVHGGVSTPKAVKHEGGGFIKTKSKAMKIYNDLKKVKQPISPGGKLASFINSLFTSGSPKNPKKKSMSEQTTSTCSSASSLSRSCLSTTKANVGTRTKRSVRFCPVSVILDEDSRPCGELKIRHENELQASMRKPVTSKEIEYRFIEENRRVAEAARELLNSYRKQKNEEFDMRDAADKDGEDEAASYASSDLFELDNLSAVGNERYLEELPVYETTHFDTNRAIAKGLIL
ncbi:Detected protein of unknown function [Hibiscus syriacus]|uniref:Protein BIG GRAIN 1-like A n=1 Tax=Hibiscus syriacus TaxID=106335 RepID=A0A6A2XEH3_HIBSY|nr:protein BIG GRAIN 1-like A [Hibiscus syriacus]KAE8674171.1 Detected protein of unknown function [Hibiscus syriacus]